MYLFNTHSHIDYFPKITVPKHYRDSKDNEATIRILGGGGLLEINIFVGKLGEINEWPQGMVEIQPKLRWKKSSFPSPLWNSLHKIGKNGKNSS